MIRLNEKFTHFLSQNQRTMLRTALALAADRYDEYVKEFSDQAERIALYMKENPTAQPWMTEAGARTMQAQFQLQANQTRELIHLFDGDNEDEDEPVILIARDVPQNDLGGSEFHA